MSVMTALLSFFALVLTVSVPYEAQMLKHLGELYKSNTIPSVMPSRGIKSIMIVAGGGILLTLVCMILEFFCNFSASTNLLDYLMALTIIIAILTAVFLTCFMWNSYVKSKHHEEFKYWLYKELCNSLNPKKTIFKKSETMSKEKTEPLIISFGDICLSEVKNDDFDSANEGLTKFSCIIVTILENEENQALLHTCLKQLQRIYSAHHGLLLGDSGDFDKELKEFIYKQIKSNEIIGNAEYLKLFMDFNFRILKIACDKNSPYAHQFAMLPMEIFNATSINLKFSDVKYVDTLVEYYLKYQKYLVLNNENNVLYKTLLWVGGFNLYTTNKIMEQITCNTKNHSDYEMLKHCLENSFYNSVFNTDTSAQNTQVKLNKFMKKITCLVYKLEPKDQKIEFDQTVLEKDIINIYLKSLLARNFWELNIYCLANNNYDLLRKLEDIKHDTLSSDNYMIPKNVSFDQNILQFRLLMLQNSYDTSSQMNHMSDTLSMPGKNDTLNHFVFRGSPKKYFLLMVLFKYKNRDVRQTTFSQSIIKENYPFYSDLTFEHSFVAEINELRQDFKLQSIYGFGVSDIDERLVLLVEAIRFAARKISPEPKIKQSKIIFINFSKHERVRVFCSMVDLC